MAPWRPKRLPLLLRAKAAKAHGTTKVHAGRAIPAAQAAAASSSPSPPISAYGAVYYQHINHALYWGYLLRLRARVQGVYIVDGGRTLAFGFTEPPFELVEAVARKLTMASFGCDGSAEHYTLPFILGRRPYLPLQLQEVLVAYVHGEGNTRSTNGVASKVPVIPHSVVVDRDAVRGLEVVDVGWAMVPVDRARGNIRGRVRRMVVAVAAKPPAGNLEATAYNKHVTWHPYSAFLHTSLTTTLLTGTSDKSAVDNLTQPLLLFLQRVRVPATPPAGSRLVGVTDAALRTFQQNFPACDDCRSHEVSTQLRSNKIIQVGKALYPSSAPRLGATLGKLAALGRTRLAASFLAPLPTSSSAQPLAKSPPPLKPVPLAPVIAQPVAPSSPVEPVAVPIHPPAAAAAVLPGIVLSEAPDIWRTAQRLPVALRAPSVDLEPVPTWQPSPPSPPSPQMMISEWTLNPAPCQLWSPAHDTNDIDLFEPRPLSPLAAALLPEALPFVLPPAPPPPYYKDAMEVAAAAAAVHAAARAVGAKNVDPGLVRAMHVAALAMAQHHVA